jgi:leucyl-tRNA synthetase
MNKQSEQVRNMKPTGEYNANEVESKWQRIWEESRLYKVDLCSAKTPYYTHSMFPYPSGDKLHVGHWYNFAPADSFARFQRMRGFDVFCPMGFDAFGLPAENYAVKTGVHPNESISSNIKTMIEQLKKVGCMYDWEHMVVTSSPEYYRWTQWLFLLMYRRGLAIRKNANVNWCTSCQTVLANEQVHEGLCDRCETQVSSRQMAQWYWRITEYADQLLDGLEGLEWPAHTIAMQKNWIGKSNGVSFRFKVRGLSIEFEVYDSIPQTFMAQTFVTIAPEHPLVPELCKGLPNEKGVLNFVEDFARRKLADKYKTQTEVSGVFTGRYVENPYGTGDLPIWVASYVLADYGTGVVSCSAHDSRDFEFAKKYGIELRTTMLPPDVDEAAKVERFEYCYERADNGVLTSPKELAGLNWKEAREPIIQYIEKRSLGERCVQFKLRDWTISRQRYWGAPIPIVYDPMGVPHPIPEEHLPWKLPTDVDFEPTGVSPLAKSSELVERTEKIFGKGWKPEVDTMDTFVCSSFYSIRFLDPKNSERLADPTLVEKWMPVDLYIGGAEHACMHLLYSRFVTKVLHDAGYCDTREPYQGLVHQGMITNEGAKMSKSKGNAVSPDTFVKKYGSDVFRLFLMELGPFRDGADWNEGGINGAARYLQHIYNCFSKPIVSGIDVDNAVELQMHQAIEKVTLDIPRFRFHTASSSLRKLLASMEKLTSLPMRLAETFVQLLAPLTPHLAEELWREALDKERSVFESEWPIASQEILDSAKVEVPIMVNKKLVDRIRVSQDISESEQESYALGLEKVVSYLKERDLKVERVVSIPGRIVSMTAK